jgi:hypothetical protein
MLELGGDLDFPKEPIGAERSSKFRPQDLHRHLPTVLQILGQIHGGHAPLTEFTLETEVVGEGGGDAVKLCGH